MVLPLFVQHVQHDERQQPGAEALPLLVAHLVQRHLLGRERLARGFHDDLGDAFLGRGRVVPLELGHHQQVVHEQFLAKEPVIPLRRVLEFRQQVLRPLLDRAIHHLLRLAAQLLPAVERERAQRVDHLALLVHDVVVFQQPLAGLEVLQLDALLRRLDRPRDERVREHLAFLGPHAIHQLCDAVRAEQPHQVVLERQEELRGPRVALPAGTAA